MVKSSNRDLSSSSDKTPLQDAAVIKELSSPKNLNTIGTVIRALDSPIRVQIILALNARPHFVFELVKLVHSSQPLVSQHLKVLKAAGIATSERRGRQMIYSLSQPKVLDILSLALNAGENSTE